jgi:hypothetical protein
MSPEAGNAPHTTKTPRPASDRDAGTRRPGGRLVRGATRALGGRRRTTAVAVTIVLALVAWQPVAKAMVAEDPVPEESIPAGAALVVPGAGLVAEPAALLGAGQPQEAGNAAVQAAAQAGCVQAAQAPNLDKDGKRVHRLRRLPAADQQSRTGPMDLRDVPGHLPAGHPTPRPHRHPHPGPHHSPDRGPHGGPHGGPDPGPTHPAARTTATPATRRQLRGHPPPGVPADLDTDGDHIHNWCDPDVDGNG